MGNASEDRFYLHHLLLYSFSTMDQSQTKALAALQPFVHLATTTKDPSPRFVAELIKSAISAPGTYIFLCWWACCGLHCPHVRSRTLLTLARFFLCLNLRQCQSHRGVPRTFCL